MSIPFGQLDFAEIYEKHLVDPLFKPWVDPLLDDVKLTAGDRILDVACGTGIVARVAKKRVGHTGKVVGIDISPPMIAVARQIAPDIDWREGDACALPIEADEAFDIVVCQQGLQFVPDKPLALREMRRALTDGGRLAVSTWRPDHEFPVLLKLRQIAEHHLGPIADKRHSFGEVALIESLIRETGFHDVKSKAVTRTIRFDDGQTFVFLNAMALIGMSPAAQEMNDETRTQTMEAIVRDCSEVVKANTDERGFTYEIGTNVTTATA